MPSPARTAACTPARCAASAPTSAATPHAASVSSARVRRAHGASKAAIGIGGRAVAAAPVPDPFADVRAARLLVVATPTYKGTYTGLLKIFLDRFGHRELAGVVAVPVAIAASEAHRLSVGTALTDLLVELGATVPARPLAVLEPDVADAATRWATEHGDTVAEALKTVG